MILCTSVGYSILIILSLDQHNSTTNTFQPHIYIYIYQLYFGKCYFFCRPTQLWSKTSNKNNFYGQNSIMCKLKGPYQRFLAHLLQITFYITIMQTILLFYKFWWILSSRPPLASVHFHTILKSTRTLWKPWFITDIKYALVFCQCKAVRLLKSVIKLHYVKMTVNKSTTDMMLLWRITQHNRVVRVRKLICRMTVIGKQ